MLLIFMGRRFRDSDVNNHKEFLAGAQRGQIPPPPTPVPLNEQVLAGAVLWSFLI